MILTLQALPAVQSSDLSPQANMHASSVKCASFFSHSFVQWALFLQILQNLLHSLVEWFGFSGQYLHFSDFCLLTSQFRLLSDLLNFHRDV